MVVRCVKTVVAISFKEVNNVLFIETALANDVFSAE